MCVLFFFYCYGDHRYLHVLTHSFPTRRSSDLPFQLLARRPIDTAVAAPQDNMLKHGIDRLPARTKIVGNPPRQRPALRLRPPAEPEMPQNLRAMPARGAPGRHNENTAICIIDQLLTQEQHNYGEEQQTPK